MLDLKNRRVPNKVWIQMLADLIPFTIYEITFRVDEILSAVIDTSLVVVLTRMYENTFFSDMA